MYPLLYNVITNLNDKCYHQFFNSMISAHGSLRKKGFFCQKINIKQSFLKEIIF
jgi:hypothetical protein